MIKIGTSNGVLDVRIDGRVLESWGSGLRDLAGFGGESLIVPRWLFLRLLGVAYVFAFAQWCYDGMALVGPDGIEPVRRTLGFISRQNPGSLKYLAYPTVFWLNQSAVALSLVCWTGLLAAVAAALNLWPRAALAACWICFVSLVGPTIDFSPIYVDSLILETTLVAIPFAPRGLRPGFGRKQPPSPWATFFLRFLVFRILFETGFGRLTAPGGVWRDLKYAGSIHETTPFPTVLAFYDQTLPSVWRMAQSAFALVAELGAAILVFFGRRARVVGVCLFIALQLGIELTSNFGWLNFLTVALCLVMFDDRLLASVLGRVRFFFPATPAEAPAPREERGWRLFCWIPLWLANGGCGAALLEMLVQTGGVRGVGFPPIQSLLNLSFHPAGLHLPFASSDNPRILVEIQGSDDGGASWQPYLYRYVQQSEDRMCPWIAPYFARFDAAIHLYSQAEAGSRRLIFDLLGHQLLEGEPAAVSVLRSNPFPISPPLAIRFARFRMQLNDDAAYRATGQYWRRERLDDLGPTMVRDPKTGAIRYSR